MRPEIKPTTKEIANKVETELSKKESKNISEFERVERFISERYELRNNIVSNKIEFRVKNSDNKEFETLNENNIYRDLQKNFINFSINLFI